MRASIKRQYENANDKMIRLVRQSTTAIGGTRIRLIVPVKGGR